MRLGKLGEQIVLKSPKAFETIYFQNYENVDAEIYYIKKASASVKQDENIEDVKKKVQIFMSYSCWTS